eukprot:SAG11_NODE_867_length_6831_cov_5.720737_1_plen_137_part_00
MPVASTLAPDRSVDRLNPASAPRLRRTQTEAREWPTGKVSWSRSLRNPLWDDTNNKYIGSNPKNPNLYERSRPGTAGSVRAKSETAPRPGARESVTLRRDADGLRSAMMLPDAADRDLCAPLSGIAHFPVSRFSAA